MKRIEFMSRLCDELGKFKTPTGLNVFPCVCGENPFANDGDSIEDEEVAKAIITIIKAMVEDNNLK